MTKRTADTYTGIQGKVALAAIRGERRWPSLAAAVAFTRIQIATWKTQLIERSAGYSTRWRRWRAAPRWT